MHSKMELFNAPLVPNPKHPKGKPLFFNQEHLKIRLPVSTLGRVPNAKDLKLDGNFKLPFPLCLRIPLSFWPPAL